MRDQLNEPLGMGSDPLAHAASIGGWTFLMAAALVALAVGLGEEYLLLSLRPHNSTGLVARSVAQATAPANSPPLRLAEAPAKPPPLVDTAEKVAAPSSTGTVRVHSGAPEPLIIDVQQALARLRAQDPSAAAR